MSYRPDGPVGPRLALQPIFPLTELQVENFRGVMHATLFPLHSRLNIFMGATPAARRRCWTLCGLACAAGAAAAAELPGR